jgi:C4-dicarboxylate transporter/malic acid transport protein
MSDTTTVLSTPGGAVAAGAPPDRPSKSAPLARLRGFHPGWYGAVMGTAIVGVAASMNPGGAPSLVSAARTFGQVMAIAAAVLATLLALGYLGRFIWHPRAALADLRDPAVGALYSTVPGGILVLAAAAAAIGPTWFSPTVVRDLVVSFDWAGVPLAFLMSAIFAYVLFAHPGLGGEEVNGSWFIPPVANIVVPLVLAPLVPAATPAVARDLLVASYGFWGMGFLLYLFVMSMFHHRLVMYPLPHAGLAPSIWIGLGPIGVGAIGLVKLSAVATKAFGPAAPVLGLVSKLAATAIWGFGAWWLVAAVILLVRYLAHGHFPYSVGWWAFTFPLGAYTVATVTLAKAWGLDWLNWAGAGLFVALGLFWVVVAAGSTWALRSGAAWKASSPTPGHRGTEADTGGTAFGTAS